MTIPTDPIKLRDLDTDSLTLDDLELFEAGGFSVRGFKKFMTTHSNWTAAQVGALKVGEMKEVLTAVAAALEAAAVPKVSGSS